LSKVKNQLPPKFTSEYFKLNQTTNKLSLKLKYSVRPGFQERIAMQLKKGIYKMFLEETERKKGDALNDQYNFIREFARYGLSDYPVFYFERTYGIIMASEEWALRPEIFLAEEKQFKYLIREPSFFEFEFLGHVFGIATSRYWKLAFDNYIRKSMEAKGQFFHRWRQVKNFNDIDLSLHILDDRK